MNLPTLDTINVSGKRVLVRADLDVPLVKEANQERGGVTYRVTDDARLRADVPTIKYLLDHGAKYLVIVGHIGRPEGGHEISTFGIVRGLTEVIGRPVTYWDQDAYGKEDFDNTRDGRIHLMENVRIFPGEETNDHELAGRLAQMADVYVNESFATSHRKHASIVGTPEVMSNQGKATVAGLRFAQEIKVLSGVLNKPDRPLVVVIGGAKIETKLPVISAMEKHADAVLVGGKLPSEIASKELSFSEKVRVASLSENGKDISQESAKSFAGVIGNMKMVIWNGPMGMFELEGDDLGTRIVAAAIANSSAKKIAGGGDTEAAIEKFGLTKEFNWISIGGGAMLEYLAHRTLPGIEALGV
jgi:phosphoglycerate kinase